MADPARGTGTVDSAGWPRRVCLSPGGIGGGGIGMVMLNLAEAFLDEGREVDLLLLDEARAARCRRGCAPSGSGRGREARCRGSCATCGVRGPSSSSRRATTSTSSCWPGGTWLASRRSRHWSGPITRMAARSFAAARGGRPAWPTGPTARWRPGRMPASPSPGGWRATWSSGCAGPRARWRSSTIRSGPRGDGPRSGRLARIPGWPRAGPASGVPRRRSCSARAGSRRRRTFPRCSTPSRGFAAGGRARA
jgi:hypothetical protein